MNKEKPFLIRALSKKGMDFLILFLAITLGFFVDNYRDKYEANETVEVIAAELVGDIASDTTDINRMLRNAYVKGAMLDSLCNMLDAGTFVGRDSLLYMYSAYVNRRILFERHNSSYTLLVSTGYLRYFPRESGSVIAQYDVDCKAVSDLLFQERQLLNNKVYPLQQSIFNIDNFHSILDQGRFVAPLTLMNWSEEKTLVYRNYVSELKLLNVYIITEFQELLKSATITQEVLQKEYSCK